MYIPTKYNEQDWAQVEYLIRQYPLATVITNSPEQGIVANHFPFYLKEENGKKVLHAHIAKANHQRPDLVDGEVLVIFKSEDTYITPSYYATKADTHKVVPTWDFAAAHIKGRSKVIDDTQFVHTQLNNLTNQQEKNRAEPWKVADAPEKYVAAMQKAIIGLEIEIDSFACKYKFEQDKPMHDVDGVVAGLAKDDRPQVSALVRDTNQRRVAK
ncbi:uncharacterized protein CANTADRAFT_47239 [Suhomyces tanzawaensis NRRL Y-17324]|uniref:Negative transcriptional regulator n=1 Tax=Suhomyces tanzawaensis NRRL Y-17324 TaxID=984487 RepID=A0A1E4SP42_9ASCO|nr:uncharacterized protein CANTADRAFT_47239 [Suhomyces tanzawaensis NRRL Y-17324]ODV81291.1 hypothetical protein CANTADRAFT_47239 [Suhomyces tanzawaensis NRRL Y-17324]